jgi:competence protein ComFC
MQKLIDFGLKNFVEWKENILHLIYPNLCLNCENELSKFEDEICTICLNEVKYTSFENYQVETNLNKLFWGRIKLESTFSLFYFEKDKISQKILHQIKYKGKQDFAKKMGLLMAERLKSNPSLFETVDALIPIPLHNKKLYIRGYNQSELIANGLSEGLEIPSDTNFLSRIVHSESQTKQGRFKRWDNIVEAFHVNPNPNSYKHIALIDDVVTTGSTLESCVKLIQEQFPEMKVSIFSLAITL